jgi:hypothetical protein
MSFATMIAENRGAIPGISALLARTHIQEAWRDVRRMRGWSFQLANGGFATPSNINVGSVTTTYGSPTVTPDATAMTAWLSASIYGSLITQRQFRVGASTIYNIIAIDGTSGVITLDRPWTETSSGSGQGYSIYMCYYPVPVKNFEAWESVLDTTNVVWLKTNASRSDREYVDRNDPQRQLFTIPSVLLPRGIDTRPGSSTLGWMVYELYPQPQSPYAYSTFYSWSGPDLVLPTDTLPEPMTEECIKAYARVKGYEWLIAKLTTEGKNTSGIQFTMGAAAKEAGAMLKEIRSVDRDRVDMWNSIMTRLTGYGIISTFNPQTGQLSSRNLG